MIGDLVAGTLQKNPLRISIPFWLLDTISFINILAARVQKKPALLNRDKVLEMKQANWLCSNQRAREEIGFVPQIALPDGFQQTLSWYKEQGWL